MSEMIASLLAPLNVADLATETELVPDGEYQAIVVLPKHPKPAVSEKDTRDGKRYIFNVAFRVIDPGTEHHDALIRGDIWLNLDMNQNPPIDMKKNQKLARLMKACGLSGQATLLDVNENVVNIRVTTREYATKDGTIARQNDAIVIDSAS